MEDLGNYPLAKVKGVPDCLVRQTMLQAMAHVYAVATKCSMHEMMDAARATWDTEWDTDPSPRTIKGAVAAAESDLQHWDEG